MPQNADVTTTSDVAAPDHQDDSYSKDDIVIKGKARLKWSSLSMATGALCLFLTQFYFVFTIASLMAFTAPGSTTPEIEVYLVLALPVITPILGISTLIQRHIWVKQLRADYPIRKTRLLLKIMVAAGAVLIVVPVLVILIFVISVFIP